MQSTVHLSYLQQGITVKSKLFEVWGSVCLFLKREMSRLLGQERANLLTINQTKRFWRNLKERSAIYIHYICVMGCKSLKLQMANLAWQILVDYSVPSSSNYHTSIALVSVTERCTTNGGVTWKLFLVAGDYPFPSHCLAKSFATCIDQKKRSPFPRKMASLFSHSLKA